MKWSFLSCQLPGVEGGGTPYNGLGGAAPPKGVPFLGLTHEKVYMDLTSWSIWKGREIYHFTGKKAQKG